MTPSITVVARSASVGRQGGCVGTDAVSFPTTSTFLTGVKSRIDGGEPLT
jgi:hypothetical protein